MNVINVGKLIIVVKAFSVTDKRLAYIARHNLFVNKDKNEGLINENVTVQSKHATIVSSRPKR